LVGEVRMKETGQKRRDRASYIIFSVAMCCIVIAGIMLFGKLLHGVQPWFSIVLIAVSMIWIISYSLKAVRLARQRKRGSLFSHYVYEGLISVALLAAAIALLLLNNNYDYIHVIAAYLIAIVLMLLYGIIDMGLPNKLWTEFKEYINDAEFQKEVKNMSTSLTGRWPQTMAACLVGVAYLAVFLPITLSTSLNQNLDPINILLFVGFHPVPIGNEFVSGMKHLWSTSNEPFLYSFGVLFGIAGIVGALLNLSIKRHGFTETAITFNGLLWGYALTVWIAFVLGVTPVPIQLTQLSLAYVFFIAYIARFAVTEIEQIGLGTKAKYDLLINGLAAVATSWVLSRELNEWAVVFSGIIFYLCTFLCTTLIELLVTGAGRLTGISSRHLAPLEIGLRETIRNSPRQFWNSVCIDSVIILVFPALTVGALYLFINSL
jgi:hypothetical protein